MTGFEPGGVVRSTDDRLYAGHTDYPGSEVNQNLQPFYLFLLVLSLIGSFGRVVELIKAIYSNAWPSTDGKVVSSEVKRVKLRSPMYRPKVEYEYSIKGKTYSAERLSFSEFNLFYDAAQRIVAQYPLGESVTVFYNPRNPNDSVLIKGRIGRAFSLFLGMAAVAAYFLWIVIRRGYLQQLLRP